MSDDQQLTIVEQREVAFYGDTLTAVQAKDGQVYVSVRHMCDALGLTRQSQVRRIKRSDILLDGYKGGAILAPPSQDGRGGGPQNANFLRVDLVPLFMTGISTKSVKPDIQPKLERFQKEAAKVLWEAFQEGRLTADSLFDELLQTDSDAVQAYKMLQGMVKLARHQILMEARLTNQEKILTDYGNRLETLEAQFGDESRTVSEDQASQISQAVKTIAILLTKRSGSNQFGSVYGELYRKFGTTSYKMLPAAKFGDAIQWLNNWYEELTGETPF